VDTLRQKTNNLNRQKVGVVFYYFDYNIKDQTAGNVVKCLLKQLVYQLGPLPPILESAYDSWVRDGVKPSQNLFSDVLVACSKQFSLVFIVLDAFDECPNSERSELVNHLDLFSQAQLRVFLTTRPHVRELDRVKKSLQASDSDILEIIAQGEDVEKYLARKMDERAEDIDEELRTAIVEKITLGLQGQYNSIFVLSNW
jgi:hypothetical protein